MNITKGVRPSN